MPRALPFVLALVITLLIGAAVRMEPHFAGDVPVARAVQAVSPGTSWATTYTQSAVSPAKWIVAAVALVICFAFAGWPGALFFVVVLTLEQTVGEPSKSLFMRPRPSPDLVQVVGRPTGYSFPSTFMTFHTVVLGSIWLLARQARASAGRSIALLAVPLLIIVGWACRVVVGAHWPSDVVLTTILWGMWLALLLYVMQLLLVRRPSASVVRTR
jgi:membrane-associated phospholipid phosphatase